MIEKEGVIVNYSWEQLFRIVQNSARPGHMEVTPKDPEWLKKRDQFEEAWNALNDEGRAAGFLEDDYEGGVYITEGIEDRKWVYDD